MAWNPEDLHHDVMGRAVRGFNKGGIVEPTMSTYFGATKEDLEYAGVEAGIGGEISLSEKVAEKGGKLTMQDLMEMQGHGR